MTSEPNHSNRSAADRIYGAIGTIIPNCGTALRLVEIGQERPLTFRERFVLKYNSPLCLHCNCNREKFDAELERMREIEKTRNDEGNSDDAQ